MARERVVHDDPQPISVSRWVGIIFLLMMVAGLIFIIFNPAQCIDGCGPYHNTTSVADLDGDGDLDVMLNNLRHETDTIIWAGSILWTNHGGGNFTPRNIEYGGGSAATGDVDGDGDIDVVRLDYRATLFLNQGGEQDGIPGDFKHWQSIAPPDNQHNWSAEGSVVLGDLNNDDRLDVMLSYCCSILMDKEEDIFPFLPSVWLNTIGSRYLVTLGDLPMRPTLGDLDGDGDLDVYAASLPPRGGDYDSADRILLNNGSGNFTDSGQRLVNARMAGTAGSGAVALGDLDSDDDLDALVATPSGAVIWINQGGVQGGQVGIFSTSGLRLDRGHIEDVFLADLDADGDLDAVVGGKAQASVWLDAVIAAGKAHASIWLNEGQAGFQDSRQRLRYTERFGLAVGDFNGDDYLDILAVGTGYQLWLNQGDGRLQEGN